MTKGDHLDQGRSDRSNNHKDTSLKKGRKESLKYTERFRVFFFSTFDFFYPLS